MGSTSFALRKDFREKPSAVCIYWYCAHGISIQGGFRMRKNGEAIAIYSRKSKFTGKGESIGNQVELCKETLCC